jgi:hypothetical protein
LDSEKVQCEMANDEAVERSGQKESERSMKETWRYFGNTLGSRRDAMEHAAKHGGRYGFSKEHKQWYARMMKRPRGMSVEDACWQ